MIYLDTSVALAHLLAEDREPPERLWQEPLISSRLIEYELWTRIHARKLSRSHADEARALLGRLALIELAHRCSLERWNRFPSRYERWTPFIWHRWSFSAAKDSL